ncbi:4Fe-4S dicluster domain-containing protein [Clostridium formicaceticum]|uniref:Electron transport complex protein RnfC n=1 Tax=Clostridium formicaceticum TaxID=1497 RepID=A0AAC9RNI6_9CLOT|nr:4Fe-4S dicluster domain-containing protein [Clostridium formicaceticum]AOY74595.1 NADH dehydrogenase [Clostridium formicaceticum]ARE88959.1 Electron transport complex protein RnfC [Clostridium formicaceticum]
MNLLDMVKEAGIVGAGGAGFPTHVKLQAKAEYILLNGAECEPLLRVDQQLMALFPDEIIKGFEAAGKFVGASKALIGIKGKHKKVVAILRERVEALQVGDFVEVRELPDIYPAGDEQVLVYELTGRVVPEAGIPIQVGCVVMNSETALNVYYASIQQPVIQTYITVAGDVPKPFTIKVPVGTPIIDILKLSGIEDFDNCAVIDGGPMMGPMMSSLDGYVTKKSKGFVILKKDHYLVRKKSVSIELAKRVNRSACEQCRMCTDMCPRYLLGHEMQPHKMMRALNYALTDVEGQKIAQLCCQCNLCELFSCPAGLYPKFANIHFKGKLAEENIRYTPKKSDFIARKSREYRLLPSKRLIARLGLSPFDKPAPMTEAEVKPEVVYISTRQHVGAPAVPIVSVGDYVEAGQKIGKIPEGSLGATIHASISGNIVEIEKDFIAIRRDEYAKSNRNG